MALWLNGLALPYMRLWGYRIKNNWLQETENMIKRVGSQESEILNEQDFRKIWFRKDNFNSKDVLSVPIINQKVKVSDSTDWKVEYVIWKDKVYISWDLSDLTIVTDITREWPEIIIVSWKWKLDKEWNYIASKAKPIRSDVNYDSAKVKWITVSRTYTLDTETRRGEIVLGAWGVAFRPKSPLIDVKEFLEDDD